MPSSLADRARKLARELCVNHSVHVHVEPAIANTMVQLAREFAAEALRAYVDEPYNAQQTDAEAITAAISRAENGAGR